MHHRLHSPLVLIVCGCLLSCGTVHQEKTSNEDSGAGLGESKSLNRPVVDRERIAPSRCRLVGTVVRIDSTLELSDPSHPCSRVPCRAMVRVDSIIGYGQAFSRPLSKGQEIPVSFKFTLVPTESLFPEMKVSYPGLREGSRFIADIEARDESFHHGRQEVSYFVYGYETE